MVDANYIIPAKNIKTKKRDCTNKFVNENVDTILGQDSVCVEMDVYFEVFSLAVYSTGWLGISPCPIKSPSIVSLHIFATYWFFSDLFWWLRWRMSLPCWPPDSCRVTLSSDSCVLINLCKWINVDSFWIYGQSTLSCVLMVPTVRLDLYHDCCSCTGIFITRYPYTGANSEESKRQKYSRRLYLELFDARRILNEWIPEDE